MIHRDNCSSVLKIEPDQQLDADWDVVHDQTYHTHITVSAEDSQGLLAAMAQIISAEGVNIESVETPSQKQAGTEGFIEFKFFLKIKSKTA